MIPTDVLPDGYNTPEKKQIASSVSSSNSGNARYNKNGRAKIVDHGFLCWNIGDGKADPKWAIVKDMLSNVFCHCDLIILQECTIKPHNVFSPGKQSDSSNISSSFSTRLCVPNTFWAQFTIDSCNRYLVNAWNPEYFSTRSVETKVDELRTRILGTLYRLHVCISKLYEISSKNVFYIINIHARRGDPKFCNSVLIFIDQLYKLVDDNNTPLCDGIIYGGDFNIPLFDDSNIYLPDNIALIRTDDDPRRHRKKKFRTVDFIGFHDNGEVKLLDSNLYSTGIDIGLLYSTDARSRSLIDFASDKSVLNHPIITSMVRFSLKVNDYLVDVFADLNIDNNIILLNDNNN